MALVDEIREHERRKGPRCAACVAIAKLTPQQRRGLDAIIADEQVTRTAIARWLTATTKVEVPDFTVRDHINRKHP